MDRNKIIEVIAKQFKVNACDINDETRFKEDLSADSISIVELIMNLEDEFGIVLDDEKVVNIQTIGQALDIVEDTIKENE